MEQLQRNRTDKVTNLLSFCRHHSCATTPPIRRNWRPRPTSCSAKARTLWRRATWPKRLKQSTRLWGKPNKWSRLRNRSHPRRSSKRCRLLTSWATGLRRRARVRTTVRTTPAMWVLNIGVSFGGWFAVTGRLLLFSQEDHWIEEFN